MKIFKSIAIVSIMLLSCIIVNPVQSAEINTNSTGTTWYVDDIPGEGPDNPAENFTSIQDAINACFDGDTVFVYNGTYYANLVINKSINLFGENNQNTILKDNNTENNSGEDYPPIVLLVNEDNVKISNFKIVASNYSSISSFLFFAGCSSCSITDNFFSDCRLSFVGGSDNIICNNHFKFNDDETGIYLYDSNCNEISNNSINFAECGVSLHYCKGNLIEYNLIKNSLVGIELVDDFFAKNLIRYNDFISIKLFKAFISPSRSIWSHNYWGRSLIHPKIIIGGRRGYTPPGPGPGLPIPPRFFIDFDWFPALKPNCDFGGDN